MYAVLTLTPVTIVACSLASSEDRGPMDTYQYLFTQYIKLMHAWDNDTQTDVFWVYLAKQV